LSCGNKAEAWPRRTVEFLLYRIQGEKRLTEKAREGAQAAKEKAQGRREQAIGGK
jgi:hypothetical protein